MQFTQPRFWIPILLQIAATACGTGDSTSPDTQSAAASNQAEQQEDQNEGVTTIAAGTNEDSESSIPSADEPAVDTVDLTVGVPFGIVQIATLGGIGEAPGLGSLARTTTTPITNPDELRTGFASGELDVAIMPTNVAALLFNREIDVQVIGIIDAQLLHVLGPAGSDWSDLNGATIHIPFRGDIADVTFRQLATANAVDVDGLDLRYGTSLPDLVAAAAAGEVTHAVLPEHFASAAASQAIKAGQDLAPIIDLQESWSESTGGDRLPQIAVVATRSLVSEHPHVVEAIQIATANAIERTSDDPAMAAILASKTSLPEPLVTAVLTSLNLTYRSVPEARADLDLMLQSLLDGAPDGLGGQLPADSFFAR